MSYTAYDGERRKNWQVTFHPSLHDLTVRLCTAYAAEKLDRLPRLSKSEARSAIRWELYKHGDSEQDWGTECEDPDALWEWAEEIVNRYWRRDYEEGKGI